LLDFPQAQIETFEINKENEVCYTWNTLEFLLQKYPTVKFYLLVGTDQAKVFSKWRNIKRILEIAEPICMLRAGFDCPEEWKYEKIVVPEYHISSTALRDKLSIGLYQDPLVTEFLYPEVIEYIRVNKLYENRTFSTNPCNRLSSSGDVLPDGDDH
jgi:nicotinate-nucleotide adenylyltransferase